MARPKPAKQRHRKIALPAFGAAGVSLAMASGASANAVPTTVPSQDLGGQPIITLSEEEIADVNLATFYVIDKENVQTPQAGVQLAYWRACRGCRACRACRACGGWRACGGCGCGCCASRGACRWC
jgi:hypothetical protein